MYCINNMRTRNISFFVTFYISLLILYFLGFSERDKLHGRPRNITKVKEDCCNKSWIILVTVNNGFLDFFQNWMYFYDKLLLNYQVYVIAQDDTVYLNLNKLYLNQVFTVERSWKHFTPSAVVYGSRKYKEMMSARPSYILKYLEKGLNILFADIDSVWLKDPFQFFIGNFDMWIQLDGKKFCAGFMAIKSTNDSIKFIKMWEESLTTNLLNDQLEFNVIYEKANIKIKPLDTNLFPSGALYFRKFNASKRNNVAIVHNNYILGHEKKLQRFQKFNLWFPE